MVLRGGSCDICDMNVGGRVQGRESERGWNREKMWERNNKFCLKTP